MSLGIYLERANYFRWDNGDGKLNAGFGVDLIGRCIVAVKWRPVSRRPFLARFPESFVVACPGTRWLSVTRRCSNSPPLIGWWRGRNSILVQEAQEHSQGHEPIIQPTARLQQYPRSLFSKQQHHRDSFNFICSSSNQIGHRINLCCPAR